MVFSLVQQLLHRSKTKDTCDKSKKSSCSHSNDDITPPVLEREPRLPDLLTAREKKYQAPNRSTDKTTGRSALFGIFERVKYQRSNTRKQSLFRSSLKPVAPTYNSVYPCDRNSGIARALAEYGDDLTNCQDIDEWIDQWFSANATIERLDLAENFLTERERALFRTNKPLQKQSCPNEMINKQINPQLSCTKLPHPETRALPNSAVQVPSSTNSVYNLLRGCISVESEGHKYDEVERAQIDSCHSPRNLRDRPFASTTDLKMAESDVSVNSLTVVNIKDGLQLGTKRRLPLEVGDSVLPENTRSKKCLRQGTSHLKYPISGAQANHRFAGKLKQKPFLKESYEHLDYIGRTHMTDDNKIATKYRTTGTKPIIMASGEHRESPYTVRSRCASCVGTASAVSPTLSMSEHSAVSNITLRRSSRTPLRSRHETSPPTLSSKQDRTNEQTNRRQTKPYKIFSHLSLRQGTQPMEEPEREQLLIGVNKESSTTQRSSLQASRVHSPRPPILAEESTASEQHSVKRNLILYHSVPGHNPRAAAAECVISKGKRANSVKSGINHESKEQHVRRFPDEMKPLSNKRDKLAGPKPIKPSNTLASTTVKLPAKNDKQMTTKNTKSGLVTSRTARPPIDPTNKIRKRRTSKPPWSSSVRITQRSNNCSQSVDSGIEMKSTTKPLNVLISDVNSSDFAHSQLNNSAVRFGWHNRLKQKLRQTQSHNRGISETVANRIPPLLGLDELKSYSVSSDKPLGHCHEKKKNHTDDTSDTFTPSVDSEFLHSSSEIEYAYKKRPRPGLATGKRKIDTTSDVELIYGATQPTVTISEEKLNEIKSKRKETARAEGTTVENDDEEYVTWSEASEPEPVGPHAIPGAKGFRVKKRIRRRKLKYRSRRPPRPSSVKDRPPWTSSTRNPALQFHSTRPIESIMWPEGKKPDDRFFRLYRNFKRTSGRSDNVEMEAIKRKYFSNVNHQSGDDKHCAKRFNSNGQATPMNSGELNKSSLKKRNKSKIVRSHRTRSKSKNNEMGHSVGKLTDHSFKPKYSRSLKRSRSRKCGSSHVRQSLHPPLERDITKSLASEPLLSSKVVNLAMRSHSRPTSKRRAHIAMNRSNQLASSNDLGQADFVAYISVVPSEIDELVLPFRACNLLRNYIADMHKLLVSLEKELTEAKQHKGQVNADMSASCPQSSHNATRNHSHSQSVSTGGTLKKISRTRRLLRHFLGRTVNKEKIDQALKIASQSDKNNQLSSESSSDEQPSEEPLMGNTKTVKSSFKLNRDRANFWYQILKDCKDNRLSRLIRLMEKVTDRRVYAIEVSTGCRLRLNEQKILSVHGIPCMELRITASRVEQLLNVMAEMKRELPHVYKQLVFVQRFCGKAGQGFGHQFPTTSEFFFGDTTVPNARPSLSMLRRKIPVIEQAKLANEKSKFGKKH